MKVFMTGGTGFVGTTLIRRLMENGHEVTVLTRKATSKGDWGRTGGPSYVEGDPTQPGAWQKEVPQHDAIVNLAGASIFRKWDRKGKELIRDSRVQTTRNLVQALSGGEKRGVTFLSTSAVGYYGFHGDELLDEESPAGNDFLASVTREWESAAGRAQDLGARVVICRFGIVLGKNGGPLGEMKPLFEKGLGSPLGRGNQWFSWIHEKDLADILLFLMARNDLSGPFNCTAPEPVTNRDLTQALARALGKSTILPAVPAFVVKMAKGEFASLLLEGQRVLPKKLTTYGYQFHFSDIEAALNDLLH